MRRDYYHNLLIRLLAMMVVFAPMQAAVSAIDMLAYNSDDQATHCQMDMADNPEHGSMAHGDCCQHDGACQDNCSSCTQCISVHAALIGISVLPDHLINHFPHLKTSLSKGLPGHSNFRPPRFFS